MVSKRIRKFISYFPSLCDGLNAIQRSARQRSF
jgi:hypothetical protein